MDRESRSLTDEEEVMKKGFFGGVDLDSISTVVKLCFVLYLKLLIVNLSMVM